jgi:hypothetical protein
MAVVSAVCLYLFMFIALTIYTMCTGINYKIVTVTSLNKYLHYGTSGTELYIYIYTYIYVYICVCICICLYVYKKLNSVA